MAAPGATGSGHPPCPASGFEAGAGRDIVTTRSRPRDSARGRDYFTCSPDFEFAGYFFPCDCVTV